MSVGSIGGAVAGASAGALAGAAGMSAAINASPNGAAGALGGAANVGGSQVMGVSSIVGGGSAAITNPVGVLTGAAFTQLQTLVNLLQGFSSAEVLMALWLLNGSKHQNAGMPGAFALGLLNAQVGLSFLQDFNQFAAAGAYALFPAASGSGAHGVAGSQLNIQI